MKIIETEPKTNNMSRETWKYLYKRLGQIANPQLSALRNFLEAPFQMVFSETETSQQKGYNLYMSILRLKLDGMSKEPCPIEKTMSPAQLYAINHPCWAQSHTINELYKYIQCKHNCTDYDDVLLFISDFQIIF